MQKNLRPTLGSLIPGDRSKTPVHRLQRMRKILSNRVQPTRPSQTLPNAMPQVELKNTLMLSETTFENIHRHSSKPPEAQDDFNLGLQNLVMHRCRAARAKGFEGFWGFGCVRVSLFFCVVFRWSCRFLFLTVWDSLGAQGFTEYFRLL